MGAPGVLRQRPLHVFAHQRRRMIGARPQRRQDRRRAGRIAQRHGQVAQPALVANAPDCRAGMAGLEVFRAPRKELDQRGCIETVPHVEVGQAGHAGKLVPGAGKLAVVAAIDAIAHERSQRHGNAAAMLDGQVGDAAPGIELVRRDDRLRGADVDAASTTAAVLVARCIRRHARLQRQVGQNLAEEKQGTGLPRQQQRVLATPAQARLARQLHLQQRRRVGADPVAVRADLLADARGQLLQPLAQHLVIVAATRVDGDHCLLRLRQPRGLAINPVSAIMAWPIIQPRADDPCRTRQQEPGIGPQVPVARHVVHVAVAAGIEPGLQVRHGRGGVDVGDADRTEAQLLAPRHDLPRQPGQPCLIDRARRVRVVAERRAWPLHRLGRVPERAAQR